MDKKAQQYRKIYKQAWQAYKVAEMKAILTFDLDDCDDKRKHDLALKGEEYAMFVWDFWQDVLRQYYKHGIPEKIKDKDELLEDIRDKFLEHLHERGLKTDL